jgi:hypothetical protein
MAMDGVFDFPMLEEKVTAVAQEAVLSVLEGKTFQQGKVGKAYPVRMFMLMMER